MYLVVTSDQTLAYKEHLSYSAVKLKRRSNLITKLAGTSWGASASTLRTSALTLCYSAAEYCCPVWARYSYINLDTHIIVQCAWFQAACNPRSSHDCQCSEILHLLLCVIRYMVQSIEAHQNWPMYADVFEHPPPWLASRCSIWSDMSSVNTIMQWREDWLLWSTTLLLPTLVCDSQVSISLFIYGLWWTGQGPCRANLHKWGLTQITFLWMWPVTDHEPHCRHMPVNKIWRWTESTPWNGWWQQAGIYSDSSTCRIINNWLSFTHIQHTILHNFCITYLS